MPKEEAFSQRIRLGRLLDIYGGLLTEKQRTCLQLYFEDDLSLGEISQELGVSRQAVHDLLKRVGQLLERYEDALGVLAREDRLRAGLAEALALLSQGEAPGGQERIRELLTELKDEGR